MSISPPASAVPQPLAVVGIADRRRALELRRAVGDRLGDDREIVRAGLDRHVDAVGARGAQLRERVGARQVQRRARAGAPVRFARPRRGRARSPAPRRPPGASAGTSSYDGPPGAGAAAISSASSAWTIKSAPSRAVSAIAAARPAASSGGNSGHAGVDQEALEAEHAGRVQPLQLSRRCPGPRRPRSRRRRAPARTRSRA